MTAPHCIKPASITITASIAVFIGCLCVATVPTERRTLRPDANEAADFPRELQKWPVCDAPAAVLLSPLCSGADITAGRPSPQSKIATRPLPTILPDDCLEISQGPSKMLHHCQ